MKKKYLVFFVLIPTALVGFSLMGLVFRLKARLDHSLEKGWFQPPLELYSAEEKIQQGITPKELKKKLRQRYIPFKEGQVEQSGSHPVRLNSPEKNQEPHNQTHRKQDSRNTAGPVVSSQPEHHSSNTKIQFISWEERDAEELSSEQDTFTVYFKGQEVHAIHKNQAPADFITLKPFLFAQYEGGEPILKKWTPLEKVPFHCRMAVLAAEDHNFITHGGVSPKAILRAIYKNLRAGRLKEGASTITQQLVKNIFFDSKKSWWRKFQEQIMAWLLEIRQNRQNKDQILTAYLNTIYMGQSGVFRVHGFGSASEYYVGKPLSRLNLSECALLASLIKSPGRYKPSSKNKKAKQRRDHILNTLFAKQEDWMMSLSEEELAKAKALPVPYPQNLPAPPPYFTDTVYRKIKELNWPVEKGLKVFTTLYPEAQDQADRSLKEGLKWLEKHRLEKKNQKDSGLQAVLIHVELSTGAVQAIMGGRDFKKSQFNRAVQAQRQTGSLMKPVVLLSALMENPELNPLSLVEDSPYTYKYDSQIWQPKNYNNKYKGQVPLYELLTHSLNAGTARLGVSAGLNKVIKTVEKLGGPKDLKPHPSLTLGAMESTPYTVAQMFLTLANMGQHKKQYIVEKATNMEGHILYEPTAPPAPAVVDPKKTAVLVGMLREVTRSGTARWLKSFPVAVAGKTGTTNEEKDAWFVGWTPEFLTLIWLGFDDNSSHGMTGAEGALPLWESFMKKRIASHSQVDFDWPEGVEERVVELETMGQEDLLKADSKEQPTFSAQERGQAQKETEKTGEKQTVKLIFETQAT